ncbi:MAG: GspJ family type II secretion system protein [Synergistaceae bacterium]|jgi:prepilin-type N-terminal cleavage/methylation domain-containing protein|nr:GspJ family type II secretion system protein [Synergistaceae bacterium]
MKKRGFTLVEVLIALAIGGIIVAAGIAPLMFTVRTLARSRDDFARKNVERAAVNRILQDAREMNPLNCETPFRIGKPENLGDDGRYLAVWTSAPTYYGLPASSVVWGVPGKSAPDAETRAGLYRWVISDGTMPRSLDFTALDPVSGSLALPDVRSVSFSALDGAEWNDSYEGAFPRALRVSMKYEDGESVYEEMLPRF